MSGGGPCSGVVSWSGLTVPLLLSCLCLWMEVDPLGTSACMMTQKYQKSISSATAMVSELSANFRATDTRSKTTDIIRVPFPQEGEQIFHLLPPPTSILNYYNLNKFKVQGSCSGDQRKNELSDSGQLRFLA